MSAAIKAKILIEIKELVEKDLLIFPSLPELASYAQKVASDPKVNKKLLVDVIIKDAALAARIIRVANSSMMGGCRPFTSINKAVAHLGARLTRHLVSSYASQQRIKANSAVISGKLHDIWHENIEMASIAHMLCKENQQLNSDTAILAGLIHNFGRLAILAYMDQNADFKLSPTGLTSLIDTLHGHVGTMILKMWGFPDELALVCEQYSYYDRDDIGVADYIDIVSLASLKCEQIEDDNLQTSNANKFINRYQKVDWDSLPAYKRLSVEQSSEYLDIEDVSSNMVAAMSKLADLEKQQSIKKAAQTGFYVK